MPLAYSYIRFSDLKQRSGDSVRRQTEAREAFIAKHGLTLDQSLRMLDAGVSARKSKNLDDTHALGQFLAAVKSGRVPPGSYLILENLDRLSRDKVGKSLSVFLQLVNAGIKLVQLMPVEAVFADPVEPMQVMMAVMELSRGYSESETKSVRLTASWKSKKTAARDTQAVINIARPHWLRIEDGRFQPVPEYAAVVRQMFEWCADGCGTCDIVQRLKSSGLPCFSASGRWNQGYVHSVLSSRRVIGEFQPMKDDAEDGPAIPNYFPAVVDENLFYRAQQGLKQRLRQRGRRSGSHINLFSGLMWNSVDGGSIFSQHSKANPNKRERAKTLYVNTLFRGKESRFASFPFQPLEDKVLESLTEVPVEEVLPTRSAVSVVNAKREEREGIQRRLDELVVLLADAKGKQADTLNEAVARLADQYDKVSLELANALAEEASLPATEVRDMVTLIAAVKSAADQKLTRTRLQTVLRRVIERMDCLFLRKGRRLIALVQITFKNELSQRTVVIHHRVHTVCGHGFREEHTSAETFKEGEIPSLQTPKLRAAVERRFSVFLTDEGWTKVEPNPPELQPLPPRQPSPRRKA